ncbi:transposable element Tcb2 transposase [Trichonephila clavipes]|nr:transposable element Tcb2 transposase [Trichonephila clavipes]
MSSRHHIDDFMRGRIIGKIEEGRKITDVAREFDIAHSVVSRLWKSFKTTGMCSRRHGEVVLEVRRLQKTDISSYQQKGTGAPQLSRQHRTARLQWCREHHNWTEQDWACVLFSDESRFSLSSDCRRQLIWRESGTAYRPENIQEKDRYPTCSIMVWAGIMINGRTCLHVVANGTMTGQRYIDEVLLPHVHLFRGAVGDKFVFMDDNATCHRTLAVQDCLDSEGIQRLVWPARSPDLNPIENVWDALGRQVGGRNYPPTNKNTLIRALTEEWDKLPQKLLDNVVQSCTNSLGQPTEHGQKWIHHSDVCQECSCRDGISKCERIACKIPCTHPVMRSDVCCPECNGRETVLASSFYSQYGLSTISGLPLHDDKGRYRPEKSMTDSQKDLSRLVAIYFVVFQCCQVLGRIYQNNAEIPSSDACRKCYCYKGNMECESVSCPVMTCENALKEPGSCCPTCKKCHFQGLTVKDGEKFQPQSDSCYTCTCDDPARTITQIYRASIPPNGGFLSTLGLERESYGHEFATVTTQSPQPLAVWEMK